MSEPRVVVASRIYPPEVGAASFRLRRLAVALAGAGADVRVLTTRAPAVAAPPSDPGVEVRRWPVLRGRDGAVRGYLPYLSFDLPLLIRLVLGPRPDLIVAEPPPTTGLAVGLAARLRRAPYAYYAADVWSDAAAATEAPRWLVGLLRRAESRVLRHAEVVLAVSEEVRDRVVALGTAPGRVHVVGNGVDTEIFTPSGGSAAASEPLAVYTGTMSEWQGAEVFVRAMPAVLYELPEARLAFLGQGSDEANLRQLAGTLAPGAVSFHGLRPPDEAARWLRAARAALVSIRPGAGYDFARPTKIFAAAACGTPVVFAGQGAGAQLVRDAGLGAAVPHQPDEVARAIVEALRNPHDEAARARRAAWVDEHASLAAQARLAAERLLATRGG